MKKAILTLSLLLTAAGFAYGAPLECAEAPTSAQPVPVDRQRVEWLSRATRALNESPAVHERMMDAFRRDDPKTFAKVVTEHWRKYGIEPPADKCDPYVYSYVFVLRPPELVQRCEWVHQISAPSSSTVSKAPAMTPPTGTSQAILNWLVGQGLVQCRWVLEKQEAELQIIKKFVQGICPPGTF